MKTYEICGIGLIALLFGLIMLIWDFLIRPHGVAYFFHCYTCGETTDHELVKKTETAEYWKCRVCGHTEKVKK